MSTVLDAIAKRSSTRGYTTDPLTKGELEALLQAGLQAPTGANRQEIHFTVLSGANPLLDEIGNEMYRLRNINKGEHNFYYEAPTLIFLSAEDGYRWSTLDAGIAVQNMALAAEELGLGSLIIGCILDAMQGERKAEFAKKLQFPEGYSFQIAIAVGHKAVEKEPHTYDAQRQVTCL